MSVIDHVKNILVFMKNHWNSESQTARHKSEILWRKNSKLPETADSVCLSMCLSQKSWPGFSLSFAQSHCSCWNTQQEEDDRMKMRIHLRASVTCFERPMAAKAKVKMPKGLPIRSWGPEGTYFSTTLFKYLHVLYFWAPNFPLQQTQSFCASLYVSPLCTYARMLPEKWKLVRERWLPEL